MNMGSELVSLYKKIEPYLIDAFVKYYGEEHRYKIENLINNLTIIFASHNIGSASFKERALKYKDSSIKKEYYENLSSIKSDKNSIIISYVGEVPEKLRLEVENYDDKYALGYADIGSYDKSILVTFGYGIDVETLIHEMNHLLTKDILAINRENGELIKSYGFNNEGDFVYEIINDYMTLDIMNDFKELLPKDIFGNLLLTFKTSSGYTNLDDVLGNPIKEMYLFKDIIKSSLINKDGSKIRNILGKENYCNINITLSKYYNGLRNYINEYPNIAKNDASSLISQKGRQNLDHMKHVISNCFISFINYNEELSKELDSLENEGTIRKM